MHTLALQFRIRAWGTPQAPPSEFALFYFGRNDTTKGPVYLSREGAERCVARWKARAIELAADYEHACLSPATEGAPASAWFDLAVRDDGLYAVNVRWSARAKSYFEKGEYRYHSPYVNVEPDRQGKQWVVELINFALTNWPATNRQRPLVARAFAAGRRFTMLDPAKLKEVIEALEKTSLSPEEAAAIIGGCATGGPAAPADEPMTEPAPEGDAPLTTPAAPSLAASLKAALSLPQGADERAALALVRTYAKERDDMAKRLSALEQDKTQRDKEERAALFSDFERRGKLRHADKTEAKKLLDRHGPEAFRIAYSGVPDLEQPSPAQFGKLPSSGIGGAIETAMDRAPVVNADKAVPVDQIRAYMKQHGVTAAKAATALSCAK